MFLLDVHQVAIWQVLRRGLSPSQCWVNLSLCGLGDRFHTFLGFIYLISSWAWFHLFDFNIFIYVFLQAWLFLINSYCVILSASKNKSVMYWWHQRDGDLCTHHVNKHPSSFSTWSLPEKGITLWVEAGWAHSHPFSALLPPHTGITHRHQRIQFLDKSVKPMLRGRK